MSQQLLRLLQPGTHCHVLAAGVRFSGLTADDRMSSGELGPVSRRRVGSADESTEMEAELARIHREMQRRFGDQVCDKALSYQ